MSVGRITVGLGIALVAGGGAFFLIMSNASEKDGPIQIVEPVREETVRVLIANREFQRGERLSPEDVDWVAWPKKAIQDSFLTDQNESTREQLVEAVARTLIVVGEPIIEAKLVRPGDAGLMAAILAPGMRAVTMRVTPETASGGFILPGDRVDIFHTEDDGDSQLKTRTLFEEVRVLAIDTVYAENQEAPYIEGASVTLELSPKNAEAFVTARSFGTLSLALRSVFKPEGEMQSKDKRSTDVRVIRYGQS